MANKQICLQNIFVVKETVPKDRHIWGELLAGVCVFGLAASHAINHPCQT